MKSTRVLSWACAFRQRAVSGTCFFFAISLTLTRLSGEELSAEGCPYKSGRIHGTVIAGFVLQCGR
jgi:hypothetical protein